MNPYVGRGFEAEDDYGVLSKLDRENRTDEHSIDHLKAAAVAKNVKAVQQYFETWQASPVAKRLPIDGFTVVLYEAVINQSTETVTCLLDYGLPMTAELFLAATQAESYGILQAVLDHGWDINTPMNLLTLPALAYALPTIHGLT